MTAVVVRQPWAALIAHGFKTIETRSAPPNGPMRPEGVRGLPGPAIEPGERIAIVAGKQKADVAEVGIEPYLPLMDPDRNGMLVCPLAFGAVVCTVSVTGVLPIVGETGDHDDELYQTIDGRDLARQTVTGDPSAAINVHTTWLTGQLPLGDFTPGRWGWLLADVERTDPVPCRGRQGVFALDGFVATEKDT